ncbi:MAG: hypothetical protein WC005_05665, partial [Candidatus Nanopelagicales bacterium]
MGDFLNRLSGCGKAMRRPILHLLASNFDRMQPVIVRPIADGDRSRVAQLMNESDLDLSWQAFEVERPPDLCPIFVAEYEGQIAGFIGGRFDSEYHERLGIV